MSENLGSKDSVQNIDDYEREKIISTAKDLERVATRLRRYLAYADELTDMSIAIQHPIDLDGLRKLVSFPGSDISKIETLAEDALRNAEHSAKASGENVQTIQKVVEEKLNKMLKK